MKKTKFLVNFEGSSSVAKLDFVNKEESYLD